MDISHFMYEQYLGMTSMLKARKKKISQILSVFLYKDLYIVQTKQQGPIQKAYFVSYPLRHVWIPTKTASVV
jgi:hypothetical protein